MVEKILLTIIFNNSEYLRYEVKFLLNHILEEKALLWLLIRINKFLHNDNNFYSCHSSFL